MSTGNKYVDAMGEISFEGNIIPMEWFNQLRLKTTGCADHVAILLLSEIVYLYRPKIERDEKSGSTVRHSKRFAADLLQKSYRDLADQFGFTWRQVELAILRLEKDYHLITRVPRIVDTGYQKLGNVLFLAPHVENIRAITHPHNNSRTTLLHVNVGASPRKSRTYTEKKKTEGLPSIVSQDVAAEDSLPYSTTPQEVSRGEEERLDAASRPRHNMVDKGESLLGEAEGDDSPHPRDNSEHPKSELLPQDKTPELDSSDRGKTRKTRHIEEEAQEVLAHLNRITGKRLTSTGLIPARLKEGRTVDDCTLVCDWILATWSKDYADRSVNYETPFRARKFELYLDSAQRWGWTQQPKTLSPPPSPAAPGEAPAAVDDALLSLICAAIPERSPHAPR